ncbi:MAG: LuxR C-terminal-related transcriptional regulator [Vicinamibacterales bacterium]
MAAGLRVLVASDVRLYRDGLVWSLAAHARIRVEGSADSGAAALARLEGSAVTVLLVDMSMEGAINLIHAASVSYPEIHTVAYTVGLDEQSVFRCIEAGAKGYVNRDATVDDLVSTVESVARGESPCPPRLAASLFRRVAALAQSGQTAGPAPALTQREAQIAELLERGLSNQEIAAHLGIELATAKNHVHHILEKLQVRRRSQVGDRLGWRQRTGPHPAGR